VRARPIEDGVVFAAGPQGLALQSMAMQTRWPSCRAAACTRRWRRGQLIAI
jgi:hypothetical protein